MSIGNCRIQAVLLDVGPQAGTGFFGDHRHDHSCLASILAPLSTCRGFPRVGGCGGCAAPPRTVPLEQQLLRFLRSTQQYSHSHLHTPLSLLLSVFTLARLLRVVRKTHARTQTHTQQQCCQNSHLLSLTGLFLEGWCSRTASSCLRIGLRTWRGARPGVSLLSSFINTGFKTEYREPHLALASHCGEPLSSVPLLYLGEVWPLLSYPWEPDLERLTPPLEEVGPFQTIVGVFTKVCQQHALSPVTAPNQAWRVWVSTGPGAE